MASRQGARPKSSEITLEYNNQALTEVKTIFDRLAHERAFTDIQTKIDIGHIYTDLKRLYDPVQEAVMDLVDEYGDEADPKKKAAAEREFQKKHKELMRRGEYTLVVQKPLKLSALMVKRRKDTGEREDELFELSADEIVKLGPILDTDA